VCPPEKTPENLPAGFDGTPSPVLFEGKTCRIAAIFSDSCHNAAKFLCNPDWVAERSGSEPSLPSFTGSAPGTSPARRRFRSWSPPGSSCGSGDSLALSRARTFERIAESKQGVRGSHYAERQGVPGTHRKIRRELRYRGLRSATRIRVLSAIAIYQHLFARIEE